MTFDSTSGGVPAPNNSSGVRPPRVVCLNPSRMTVEVPSVVHSTLRSARSAVPAASRPIGSSRREVQRAESTVVVQQISPTPVSPKKKVVKKSKNVPVRKKRMLVLIKSTEVIVSFFVFLPPFKALVDVFDVVSLFIYFIYSRLILSFSLLFLTLL
jgi:hypothetical protein